MNENRGMLEVVDQDDKVIGLERRDIVHQQGLLHREIHIWFYTSKGELIFQRRAKDKDTYPDKLDATVGGHVEPNMTYEETAVKEAQEETGINIDISKLIMLKKLKIKHYDIDSGLTNNTIRIQYAYLYNKPINTLIAEPGKIQGFEAWPIQNILNISDEDSKEFNPLYLEPVFTDLFKQIQELVQ